MQINVSQLLKAPIGTKRDYDIDERIDVGGDSRSIHGSVYLTRTNRGILLEGTLFTDSEVTCCRCLGSFNCPLTINIEEEYFPVADVDTGAPIEVPDEPGCFTIDEHHVLDLTEAVLQYALMAAPMKPLCRQDCAGLCPGCGRDLNKGECECPPGETDPRWTKLKEYSNH